MLLRADVLSNLCTRESEDKVFRSMVDPNVYESDKKSI